MPSLVTLRRIAGVKTAGPRRTGNQTTTLRFCQGSRTRKARRPICEDSWMAAEPAFETACRALLNERGPGPLRRALTAEVERLNPRLRIDRAMEARDIRAMRLATGESLEARLVWLLEMAPPKVAKDIETVAAIL